MIRTDPVVVNTDEVEITVSDGFNAVVENEAT
jgi:hypothetical protein